MSIKAQNIFVNLPVKNLEQSKDFFSQLGFNFNLQFTDDKAACLILGENIFAMLLVEDFFSTFINKGVSNAKEASEVIVALSASSKEQVVEVVGKAIRAGGKRTKEPIDHGFMYVESFEDLDGHLWEFAFMNSEDME